MRMVRGFYNEQNNIVNVIHYDTNCIISLDSGKWDSGLRTTPNFQGRMDALAIDDLVEYVRLMLSGEMQVWLDALDIRCKMLYWLGAVHSDWMLEGVCGHIVRIWRRTGEWREEQLRNQSNKE